MDPLPIKSDDKPDQLSPTDPTPSRTLQVSHPTSTPAQISLASAILSGKDDLARALYARTYAKISTATYDWAVIVLMLLLGLTSDLVASYTNPNSTAELDTVFVGIASSLIILVSHVDAWFKHHYIGADAAIGVVFGVHRLILSIRTGWAWAGSVSGSEGIVLPEWMFQIYTLVMIFIGENHVSTATAVILYVNLALYCIILGFRYPLVTMAIVLAKVRGGREGMNKLDEFVRRWKNWVAAGFAVFLGVVFVYVEVKENSEGVGVLQEKMEEWKPCLKLGTGFMILWGLLVGTVGIVCWGAVNLWGLCVYLRGRCIRERIV
ncbi:uncharacterized protein LOC118433307 [Folsomia candida]|uniref:Uncharacterized protein n=1 Tax=Folsomia candida TaxID=158441 RepID=A0A226CZ06_FOLCA|nr:uncharacterized protein LOC118433307 [Folsomia candida]OXA38193.1 hypothetical protein Fcan01_27020 [Folsomia candida]